MIRGTTRRLWPGTLTRGQHLARILGGCRHVWNWLIGLNEDRMRAWKEGHGEKPSIAFFNLGREFTALRNSPGYEWLRELPFAPLRYTAKRYTNTMREAVQGKRGFPRRKYASDRRGSFAITEPRIRDDKLWIPGVRGGGQRGFWCPMTRRGGDPHAHGTAKQVVVERDTRGRWYAHIFWEVPDAAPADDGRDIGVDMNVRQVTASDGGVLRAPNVARLEKRQHRYERRMARCKRVPLIDRETGEPRRKKNGDLIYRNSSRREMWRVRRAKVMRKIANARRNFAHHTSAELARQAGTIFIEDLQIRNMVKSARGTREQPGRNVRAKSGLNRAILSTVWGAIARFLDYKAHRVVRVPPQYTSQTCSRCGHVAAENRPAQPKFKCVSCGHAENADVNAALNILRRGRSLMDVEGGNRGGGAFSPA